MGYDVVEIPVEDPALIDGKKVKAALIENGLEAIVCGAFGTRRDLTNDDSSYHETSFAYIDECFKICEALDAKISRGADVFRGWESTPGIF